MSDSKHGVRNSTLEHRATRSAVTLLLALGCVALALTPIRAEEPPRPAPPPAAPLATPPIVVPLEAPSAPPAAAPRLTMEQLVDLVGPVALYPDPLLASLLPATAYPLDVVAAARLVRQNGGKAVAPPADSTWDDSVEALLQFPDVLLWLDQNLPWLEQMGIAVASQQGEVLEAIQVFRRKARDAGNLRSTPEQMVTTEPASDRPEVANVIIQPARPEICYIPVYDPYVVVNRVVVAPSYPLITFGLGFTFGAYGSWLWHDIHWGWWDPWNYRYWGGIYLHDSPYYWSQPRSPGWWYGPHRPPLWQAPYRGGMHARGKHGGATGGGGGPGGPAPGGYSGAHGMKPLGWDSRSSPTLRPYSSVSPPARTSRGAQSLGRRTAPSSTRPPTSLSTPRSLPGPTPTAPRIFGGTSATPRTYGPFGNSVRTTGPSPGAAGVRTTTPTPGPTINRWRDRGLRSLTPSSTSVPRTTNVPRAVPSTSTTVRRATPPTIAPTTRYGASSRRSVPMWPTMTGRASSNRGHQSLGSRSSAAPRSSRGGRR